MRRVNSLHVPALAVRTFKFRCTPTEGVANARTAIQASTGTILCTRLFSVRIKIHDRGSGRPDQGVS